MVHCVVRVLKEDPFEPRFSSLSRYEPPITSWIPIE